MPFLLRERFGPLPVYLLTLPVICLLFSPDPFVSREKHCKEHQRSRAHPASARERHHTTATEYVRADMQKKTLSTHTLCHLYFCVFMIVLIIHVYSRDQISPQKAWLSHSTPFASLFLPHMPSYACQSYYVEIGLVWRSLRADWLSYQSSGRFKDLWRGTLPPHRQLRGRGRRKGRGGKVSICNITWAAGSVGHPLHDGHRNLCLILVRFLIPRRRGFLALASTRLSHIVMSLQTLGHRLLGSFLF